MSRNVVVPHPVVPEPGAYPGLDPEPYFGWWAWSNTLSKHFERSAAHALAYLQDQEEKQKESKARRDGRLIHTAVLEPDELDPRYMVAPARCRAKKRDGKQCTNTPTALHRKIGWVCGVHGKDPDELEDPGKEIIDIDSWNMAQKIRDNVLASASASAFIDGDGDQEVSIAWDDRETGVRCKARFDRVAKDVLGLGPAVVDLKSTEDAREESFIHDAFKFGYHRQGGLYTSGGVEVGLESRHYAIVAVEKKWPHLVQVHRVTSAALDTGLEAHRALMRPFAECLEKDEWPGYPDRVGELSLPEYGWKRHEEFIQQIGRTAA